MWLGKGRDVIEQGIESLQDRRCGLTTDLLRDDRLSKMPKWRRALVGAKTVRTGRLDERGHHGIACRKVRGETLAREATTHR